jgi:hypothetical protein
MASESFLPAALLRRDYDKALEIHPKLPSIPGIFDVPADTTISTHSPHDHIVEHLHDHLPHMHIRYGFEIPQQSLQGIDAAALEVVMVIQNEHRVDCNPVFVARGNGAEGVCLKIAGQDVHWVHSDEASKKGAELLARTGRRVPSGYYASGFRTSDLDERNVRRYTRTELLAAIGQGLRADQHFQATWKEPRPEPIEPYEVTILLSDDESSYYTTFRLPVIVPIGAW